MEVLVTIAVGAFIGFSSGMFGIGGALVATPLLKVFVGLPALLALATPLPAAIPSAISGSIAYARQRLVRFDVAIRVLPIALPLNLLGAWLTKHVPGSMLMVLTGIVLAYSAATFLDRGWRRNRRRSSAEPSIDDAETASNTPDARGGGIRLVGFAAGALAGFMSGFLAIGGGIVMVPAFVNVLRMPMKQALATSLFCVAALAVPGVAVHAWLGHIDWPVALVLSVVVIPMSYLGARVASSLRGVTLERIYGLVMLAFAVFFVIRNL